MRKANGYWGEFWKCLKENCYHFIPKYLHRNYSCEKANNSNKKNDDDYDDDVLSRKTI